MLYTGCQRLLNGPKEQAVCNVSLSRSRSLQFWFPVAAEPCGIVEGISLSTALTLVTWARRTFLVEDAHTQEMAWLWDAHKQEMAWLWDEACCFINQTYCVPYHLLWKWVSHLCFYWKEGTPSFQQFISTVSLSLFQGEKCVCVSVCVGMCDVFVW